MSRRTRSFLMDNSIGKIFTNSNSSTDYTADRLIAGTKKISKGYVAPSKTTAVVSNNIGTGAGLFLGTSGVITTITLSAFTAATGATIIFRIKKGTTYETAEVLGSYELPIGLKTTTHNVSFSWNNSEFFYVDITQIGSVKKGAGVGATFGYYAG